jgi:TolB-like protein/DNA-binding winged helix-turn-helix (wHTH) protein/Tfp pilus assembly protein PilF
MPSSWSAGRLDARDTAQRDRSYSFLEFTLDLAGERLTRGGIEIKLRPKSFQVLRYLVERHGRLVTREELLHAVWGDVAVTDESVTKCIADIRKALTDDAQEIIRTVTRRGFLFQPEVRLVHRARVLDERENPPEQERQSPRRVLKRLLVRRRAMLVAATAALGLLAAFVRLQWRGNLLDRGPAFEAIAVLPFESFSNSADQQYLADGMTDALITYLGQASPLRVIARTSIGRYQRTKKSVQEIARELNVDVVVEGTIAQSGDRIRATANLIQVSPEKHIWARSYEGTVGDALTLQNEIAGAIATEVRGTLTPIQPSRAAVVRPIGPAAQLAYWKARYFLHGRRDVENAKKSIEYAAQAVQHDPAYAPAHAALAMSYLMLSNMGGTFPRDIVPQAKAAAVQAIALDDQLADGHVALGAILLAYDWDWNGASREVTRALRLNPSHGDARQLLANYLAAVGRVDEAVAEIKRARNLDPFSFYINRNVGRILYFARKYDEAVAELRQATDMQPNSSVVDVWIVKCYLKQGRADEAVAADLQLHPTRDGLDPRAVETLRAAYSHEGLPGYWEKLLELTLPLHRASVFGPWHLAETYAYLEDKDEAFRWLDKAYEVKSGTMPWIKVDPSLDYLRSDPRFGALLRRMGLTP